MLKIIIIKGKIIQKKIIKTQGVKYANKKTNYCHR